MVRMSSARVKKLDALTTLRFIAAAMIVLHHCAGSFGIPANVAGPFVLDQAVSFFFVLSGFILTYVYPTLDTWEARGRFWLARFGRIWPAHLAAFILLWIILQKPSRFPTGTSTWYLAILNLMMVHAWIPIHNFAFSYNNVSWSISTEMFFYVAFPVLIWKWGKTWWWKIPIVAGIALTMVWICNRENLPWQDPWRISQNAMVYIHPLARMLEFSIGMLTALLFRNTAGRVRAYAHEETPAERVGHWHLLAMSALEIAALAVVVWNMYESAWLVVKITGLPPPPLSPQNEWLGHGPVCCLSFAALIYIMAIDAGLISRMLGSRFGVLLGEISFTVYLLHAMMIAFYQQNAAVYAGYPNWLNYLFFWAILLVGAWLVWAGFERPVRAWIVSRWPRKDHKPARIHGETKVPPRGFWHALLAPTWRQLALGVIVWMLLMVPTAVGFMRKSYKTDDAAATQIAQRALTGSTHIQFGDKLELLGVELTPQGENTQLRLAWRSLADDKLDYHAAIHFRKNDDESDQQFSGQEEILLTGRVASGTHWIDTLAVPSSKLKGAKFLSIALYDAGNRYQLIANGRTDWHGARLVVEIPSGLRQ